MAGGGDVLLAGIDDVLDRSLSLFCKKPRIVLADPDDDLVLLGSAAIAIDYAYSHPTEIFMKEAARQPYRKAGSAPPTGKTTGGAA